MDNSQETPTFVTMKVRNHIPALIREVQDVFCTKRGIKPPISDALVNALKHYKDKLQSEPVRV